MSAWADRIRLARDGWSTEIRITETGISPETAKTHRALGVWARTWFWSGWISDVCLHDHAIVPMERDAMVSTIERVTANLRATCLQARLDFRDSIPCLAGGREPCGRLRLTENTWAFRNRAAVPRRDHPRELIPETIALSAERSHAPALVDTALSGLHVEDRLSGDFGPPALLRDLRERSWGYTTCLVVRDIDGRKLRFRPQRSSTVFLDEDMVAAAMRDAADALTAEFRDFGPGGCREGETLNGLPPGFSWLQAPAPPDPGPEPG